MKRSDEKPKLPIKMPVGLKAELQKSGYTILEDGADGFLGKGEGGVVYRVNTPEGGSDW